MILYRHLLNSQEVYVIRWLYLNDYTSTISSFLVITLAFIFLHSIDLGPLLVYSLTYTIILADFVYVLLILSQYLFFQ